MNGLLVTLPLLLLVFPSLYTSHAPILVLKKIACAIRVSLHSRVLNYSRERGEPQKMPPEWLLCTTEVDHFGGWERFSHQAAASQDYLSDFQSQINWVQLLGKAKTPRMQCCQQNLSVPVERWGIVSCVWLASGDDASVSSIEAKC